MTKNELKSLLKENNLTFEKTDTGVVLIGDSMENLLKKASEYDEKISIKRLQELLNKLYLDSLTNHKDDRLQGYEYDSKGKLLSNNFNCKLFLNSFHEFANKLKYNEFFQQPEFDGHPFTDSDNNHIYAAFDDNLGIKNHGIIDVAVSEILRENSYHPIKQYLSGLKWDGIERVEKFFIHYLDVEDTELHREMTKKWFMAAYSGIIHPGRKFDNMIVLQGDQGIGKSTIIEKISLGHYVYINVKEIEKENDITQKCATAWIGNLDEMDGWKNTDVGTIKNFLSKAKTTTRMVYRHYPEVYYRHTTFIGSLNDSTFLKDWSSVRERRFWAMHVPGSTFKKQLNSLTPEIIGQIWAETAYIYESEAARLGNWQNVYLDLDERFYDEFVAEQQQFKKYTDDQSIEYAIDILDGEYEPTVSNAQQFCHQFQNQGYLAGAVKLNIIPVSWVTHTIKQIYKTDRPGKYYAAALANKGWGYKNARFNGKVILSFIREQLIDPQPEETDVLHELNFLV